jgi:hypothetical protein
MLISKLTFVQLFQPQESKKKGVSKGLPIPVDDEIINAPVTPKVQLLDDVMPKATNRPAPIKQQQQQQQVCPPPQTNGHSSVCSNSFLATLESFPTVSDQNVCIICYILFCFHFPIYIVLNTLIAKF